MSIFSPFKNWKTYAVASSIILLVLLAGCEQETFEQWVAKIPDGLEYYYSGISDALNESNYTAMGIWADKLAQHVTKLEDKAKTFDIPKDKQALLDSAFENLTNSAKYLKRASQYMQNGDFPSGVTFIHKYNECTTNAQQLLERIGGK